VHRWPVDSFSRPSASLPVPPRPGGRASSGGKVEGNPWRHPSRGRDFTWERCARRQGPRGGGNPLQGLAIGIGEGVPVAAFHIQGAHYHTRAGSRVG
jgi:hypothetical protein